MVISGIQGRLRSRCAGAYLSYKVLKEMDKKFDRPTLRSLVNRVIITDSDLDAFCFDYFPAIKQRFSDGMDRVRKLTLLLELADPQKLLESLEEECGRISENVSRKKQNSNTIEELINMLEV